MALRDGWLPLLTVLPLILAPSVVPQATLLEAAQQGAADKVSQFLDMGADIEGKDQNGNTPLIVAAREGHTRVAEVLLEKGASLAATNNVGDTPMLVAATRGHKPMAELFIRNEVDLATANKTGDTALILAVQHKKEDVAKLLISTIRNVDVLNAKNKDGRSATWWATRNGLAEIEALLRKNGAS